MLFIPIKDLKQKRKNFFVFKECRLSSTFFSLESFPAILPVALPGIVVTQVQYLAPGFIEPHTSDLSPLIKPVSLP